MESIVEQEIDRAVSRAKRDGTPVRLSFVLDAVRTRGDCMSNAGVVLRQLVQTATEDHVAIEVDQH